MSSRRGGVCRAARQPRPGVARPGDAATRIVAARTAAAHMLSTGAAPPKAATTLIAACAWLCNDYSGQSASARSPRLMLLPRRHPAGGPRSRRRAPWPGTQPAAAPPPACSFCPAPVPSGTRRAASAAAPAPAPGDARKHTSICRTVRATMDSSTAPRSSCSRWISSMITSRTSWV